MTETVEGILGDHAFLSGLPEGTVELIAGCARRVDVRPGEFILREGETTDTLYLVYRGRVSIEVHRPGHGGVAVETVGPGATVGLSWISPPFRWQFDARAIDEVTLIAVDATRLRAKFEQNPAIGYAVLDRLATRLVERLQATRLQLLDLHGLGHDDRP
ncbi:MAG: cyclic nucleotide-binding domain-containing protein [Acidimicrobiales bacterium]|jgi:CRP-like cAMP-binding protein